MQFASGTRAAASVRAELCPPPNADRPNDGQVKFSVDVGPMGCMGYEVMDRPVSNYGVGEAVDGGQAGGGGGGGDAPYVQRLKSNRILRILERTLLIGGAMDAEALCVQSGLWVWRLHVNVSLLDDGGNAMDACVLAAVAALRHYRLPEVDIGGAGDGDDGDGAGDSSGYQETTIIHSDDREPTPLPLHHTPLTATFALFADESGTTTAVSALLDPYDREELASDGLLTWSYNKYGEMCCLDFPGGCELRPRQLMASAKLGKRRCVEICELLEKALEEAEGKAQQERMERLKTLAAESSRRPSSAVEDAGVASDAEDDMDVEEDNKEDEEYRLRALDYASGHFAASVKEDKEKKSANQQGKKDTSSLFHAILRSAQSTATDGIAGNEQGAATTTVVSDSTRQEQKKEEPVVEIIAHEKKSSEDRPKSGNSKPLQKKQKATPAVAAKPSATIDSDEEEVVQLTSEFSAMPRDRDSSASPTKPGTDSVATPMETDDAGSDVKGDDVSTPVERGSSKQSGQKGSSSKKTKSKPAVEEEDVTDLTQALKKKKKKKSKTKK